MNRRGSATRLQVKGTMKRCLNRLIVTFSALKRDPAGQADSHNHQEHVAQSPITRGPIIIKYPASRSTHQLFRPPLQAQRLQAPRGG